MRLPRLREPWTGEVAVRDTEDRLLHHVDARLAELRGELSTGCAEAIVLAVKKVPLRASEPASMRLRLRR